MECADTHLLCNKWTFSWVHDNRLLPLPWDTMEPVELACISYDCHMMYHMTSHMACERYLYMCPDSVIIFYSIYGI